MDISEVKVMHLQPGDTLVVRSGRALSREQAERIHQHVKPLVPEGVEVLVLDANIDLEVLRNE